MKMVAKSKKSKTKTLVIKSGKKATAKTNKKNKKITKKNPITSKSTSKPSQNKLAHKVISKKPKLKPKTTKLPPTSINFNKKNVSEKTNDQLDFNVDQGLILEYSQETLSNNGVKPTEILEHLDVREGDPTREKNLCRTNKFQPYEIDSTEEYMNEHQLRHFASILEAWKQDLMTEVDHTITEMKEAGILSDPNDRATQEEAFNLELKTRDRERKLIKKIESALSKISEQKYGYCDTCGIEIGVRRLEARPTATLCIECKTLSEIKEKRS